MPGSTECLPPVCKLVATVSSALCRGPGPCAWKACQTHALASPKQNKLVRLGAGSRPRGELAVGIGLIGSVAKWFFGRSLATGFLTRIWRLLCSVAERWPVQPTSTPAPPSPQMCKFGNGSVGHAGCCFLGPSTGCQIGSQLGFQFVGSRLGSRLSF